MPPEIVIANSRMIRRSPHRSYPIAWVARMMMMVATTAVMTRHRDASVRAAVPRSVSWSKMMAVMVGLHSMT